jgi:hypothetical protein
MFEIEVEKGKAIQHLNECAECSIEGAYCQGYIAGMDDLVIPNQDRPAIAKEKLNSLPRWDRAWAYAYRHALNQDPFGVENLRDDIAFAYNLTQLSEIEWLVSMLKDNNSVPCSLLTFHTEEGRQPPSGRYVFNSITNNPTLVLRFALNVPFEGEEMGEYPFMASRAENAFTLFKRKAGILK